MSDFRFMDNAKITIVGTDLSAKQIAAEIVKAIRTLGTSNDTTGVHVVYPGLITPYVRVQHVNIHVNDKP